MLIGPATPTFWADHSHFLWFVTWGVAGVEGVALLPIFFFR